MNPSHCLQLFLGTDKANPVFSVYHDNKTDTLHLYYGLELLEVVPNDRENVRYKLMIAQLYNAGVKAVKLTEVFGFDRKTMKKWAEALREGNVEKLMYVLAGRRDCRKLTVEIKAFIRFRFQCVYPEQKRSYSSLIRQEVQEVFGVSLSSETTRTLFNELKKKLLKETQPPCRPEPNEEDQKGEPKACGEVKKRL